MDDELLARAEEILEHSGVKGMRWGVRKDRTPGVSRSTDRQARKDAHETARSKLYYGEGAGTRRKLINKAVEARSKNDPAYRKAFDHHLSKQDNADHAQAAVKERNRTDRKDRNKKRVGAAARKVTGEWGTQAAFTTLAIGGATYLASPKARSVMTKGFNKAKNHINVKNGARTINKFLKDFG